MAINGLWKASVSIIFDLDSIKNDFVIHDSKCVISIPDITIKFQFKTPFTTFCDLGGICNEIPSKKGITKKSFLFWICCFLF